jgi:hypothetical protein
MHDFGARDRRHFDSFRGASVEAEAQHVGRLAGFVVCELRHYHYIGWLEEMVINTMKRFIIVGRQR